MKNKLTIKVVLFLSALSLLLIGPVYAESHDKTNSKVESQSDQEPVEFYDYHSGYTHTSHVYQFLLNHVTDKKTSETQPKTISETNN